MEIRFSKILHVSSELTPEKQEEVRKKLEEYGRGAQQALLGESKREIAEEFLGSIAPERRKKLEAEIRRLYKVEDEKRFRVHLVLLLIDAFAGGYCLAADATNQEKK